METFKIKKIKGTTVESVEDYVVSEIPLTLIVDNKELATLLCSPEDVEDLVRGFLFTSGLIKTTSDIGKLTLDRERWTVAIDLVRNNQTEELVFKRLFTSGCGRGTLFYNAFDITNRSKITSDLKIPSNAIHAFMVDFQKKSVMYLKTGGVHSAGIADKNGMLVFREDIGRHNAVDKVIGYAMQHNITFEDKILLTSGRISSEIIFKVRKCTIAIVVSRGTATNQAVRHARAMDITLVGFARGNRMNIYSALERIEIM